MDTRHGHVPDSLYTRHDHGDVALGRFLTWAARFGLAVVLVWLFCSDTADLGWVHVLAGVVAIPLACAATPLKETP